MKILFVSKKSPNTDARFRSLVRAGNKVDFLDSKSFFSFSNRLLRVLLTVPLGSYIVDKVSCSGLTRELKNRSDYFLIFLNQCETIGPKSLKMLKNKGTKVLNYVNDDPFGNSKNWRWKNFLKTVPLLDLLVVVRKQNITEAKNWKAKHVYRVFMAADTFLHKPLPENSADRLKWASKVAFVGSYFPERGPFFADLVRRGVPLAIYGPGWERAPEWSILKQCFRRGRISGDEYIKAVQYADICLGLLSKQNRDEHTTRTFEIPSIGTLLCAEKTDEHLSFYKEGKEAVFFNTAEECAKLCLELLSNPLRLEKIALAGHNRFNQLNQTNDKVMEEVLSALLSV